MKEKPSKEYFEEVALLMGIESSYVEKDWYVTKLILLLSEIQYEGFKLVFTGGTSLSKAHNLINRFSEDIDYKVVVSEGFNKREVLSDFKSHIVNYLRNLGFDLPADKVKSHNSNRSFIFEINYETCFDKNKSLRPHLQLEMNVKNLELPHMDLPVSSFINKYSKKLPEITSVSCIDPIEIAADKLSAITWRIPDRVRGQEPDDPSIVRHIHDLSIIEKKITDFKIFASLFVKAMNGDENRPKNNSKFASQSTKERFDKMFEILGRDKKYPKEYERFVEDMSYASSELIPRYKIAVKTIKDLTNKVLNSL